MSNYTQEYPQLSTLLPDIYNGILETDALIETEQQTYNELYSNMQQVENNAYIETSDEDRISQYERVLKLPNTGTLEYRRTKILTKISSIPPFTQRWLEKKLDELVGENNWKMNMDYNNYFLFIKVRNIDNERFQEVGNLIFSVIPCNITGMVTDNPVTTWNELHEYKWNELYDYSWNDIKNL